MFWGCALKTKKQPLYTELKRCKYKDVGAMRPIRTWSEVVRSDIFNCGVTKDITVNRDE